MRSLVLGGTGLVGRRIVERLIAAGERPLALSRSVQPDTPNVEWITGNLERPHALDLPAFDRLYCTVHCHLLASALPVFASQRLTRVVFFTSTSILTKLDSADATERGHVRMLAESERRAIGVCEKLGIAWTVLRPTIIYDEGCDPSISRLARLIERFGVFPLSGLGNGLRQPVHAEDLAAGAFQAAASDLAANRIYSMPGGETVSYREMVGRIFDGVGKPRRIVPLPPLLWRATLAIAQRAMPNANAAMGERMSKDLVFDASEAARDFGWSPRAFHPRFI